MYNRYIPQSDGSFRRSRVQEKRNEGYTQPPAPVQQIVSCQQEQQHSQTAPPKQATWNSSNNSSTVGFLRQLLPKDFDTGDLLVILLLLLMAGDGKENQNTALLTLALYLFM